MDVLKDKPVKLDLKAAIANIKRNGTPNRVYCFEHGLEPGIKQSLCDRFELCKGLDENDKHFLLSIYFGCGLLRPSGLNDSRYGRLALYNSRLLWISFASFSFLAARASCTALAAVLTACSNWPVSA